MTPEGDGNARYAAELKRISEGKASAELERRSHGPYADEPGHECGCYPASRGYPASMAKGCRGRAECWVLDELREGATPEGRARYMARYALELRNRQERPQDDRDVRSHMLKAGVPSIALSDALRPPEPPSEAMLAARHWWRKPRDLAPALVLAGVKGVGKSTAAAWAVLQWSRQLRWNEGPTGSNQNPLVWMGPADMQRISRRDDAGIELCTLAAKAALLVVDDAGHDGSRPGIEALCDIMHDRCDRGKPLILTTNLTATAFTARYGEPLSDRLRACAVAPVLRDRVSMRKAPTARWER